MVRKYPDCYHFIPEDRELIVHYLWKRLNKKPIPCDFMEEVDVYQFHPHELTERYRELKMENCWYFFTKRERKYPKGKRPNRTLPGNGHAHWKASGIDVQVVDERGIKLGDKKTLVFYSDEKQKTDWTMKEYVSIPNFPHDQDGNVELDDVVLCVIYSQEERKKPVVKAKRKVKVTKKTSGNDAE